MQLHKKILANKYSISEYLRLLTWTTTTSWQDINYVAPVPFKVLPHLDSEAEIRTNKAETCSKHLSPHYGHR